MNRSRGTLSTIAALAAVGATAAIALAAPSNGNFEEGTLKGWDQKNESGGLNRGMETTDKWKAYKGKLEVPDLDAPRGIDGPPKLEAPPQGKYAAGVASTGPGLHILHRVLNAKGESKLSFLLAYKNTADDFYSPDSFEFESIMRRGPVEAANQQLRIDLMDPEAPIKSLDPVDIYQTVFRTMPGDPRKREYAKVKTTVPGGKFRLRIAEVDNQSNFLAGVDAVKLKKK